MRWRGLPPDLEAGDAVCDARWWEDVVMYPGHDENPLRGAIEAAHCWQRAGLMTLIWLVGGGDE